jgi:TonB family protein
MIVALAACLLTVLPAWPNTDKDRKNAVKSLATEIEKAQFHKVYVPDFLDSSGSRTEKGCFLASAFSTDLAKAAHNFKVVNRIHAQKQLNEAHISAQDLQQPELPSKGALAVGADAVLVGTGTITPSHVTLFFSLRDAASRKEVYSLNYNEQLKPAFESSFPAVEDESSHFYYFPGLDGVSQPKCKYCPNPDYTDEARRNRIQGNVLMSVALDEKGAIIDARVIKTPDRDFAKRSLDVLKRWRMEPSYDMDGNPVPVRVAIEVTFRLLN